MERAIAVQSSGRPLQRASAVLLLEGRLESHCIADADEELLVVVVVAAAAAMLLKRGHP